MVLYTFSRFCHQTVGWSNATRIESLEMCSSSRAGSTLASKLNMSSFKFSASSIPTTKWSALSAPAALDSTSPASSWTSSNLQISSLNFYLLNSSLRLSNSFLWDMNTCHSILPFTERPLLQVWTRLFTLLLCSILAAEAGEQSTLHIKRDGAQ